MHGSYPNLPLVEERFAALIAEQIKEKQSDSNNFCVPDYDVLVFRQTWPDTAGIFSRPGCMSGQAFTTSYVTVIHELYTDIYGVFNGNNPVYLVTNPNQKFLDDISRHCICSIGEALSVYDESGQGICSIER